MSAWEGPPAQGPSGVPLPSLLHRLPPGAGFSQLRHVACRLSCPTVLPSPRASLSRSACGQAVLPTSAEGLPGSRALCP